MYYCLTGLFRTRTRHERAFRPVSTALILAGGLLFIVGAVVALAYRDRRPSFSYFAYGTAPKDQDF